MGAAVISGFVELLGLLLSLHQFNFFDISSRTVSSAPA